jgi:hypothetical protein
MLKLLEFFLRCLLVMLLVLGGRLDTSLQVLTDEQNLAKLVVDIPGLDLRPC